MRKIAGYALVSVPFWLLVLYYSFKIGALWALALVGGALLTAAIVTGCILYGIHLIVYD